MKPEVREEKLLPKIREIYIKAKARWDKELCNKEITTYVWGNIMNPDTWRCILPKGHKGQHRRYDK